MKFSYFVLVFLIVLTMAVSGCKSRQTSLESPLESPLSSPSPSTTSSETEEGVRTFQLDKPISAGATRVTGQGPAGVPVMLLNITVGGKVLARGEIDSDGNFELELNEPLEANYRIGLTLDDLSGTSWEPTDFTEEFYGEEAMNVPQVGFFFDTSLVQ